MKQEEIIEWYMNQNRQNQLIIIDLLNRIEKSTEILKLCNSKCSKQVINILNGDFFINE